MKRLAILVVLLFCAVSEVLAQQGWYVDLKGSIWSTWHNPENLIVRDSHAFLTSQESGMQIIDVANPADPREVGSFQLYNPFTLLGDTAIFMGNRKLTYVDISDPTDPRLISSFSSETLPTSPQNGTTQDSILFITAYFGLWIVDLNGMAEPEVLAVINPRRIGFEAIVVRDTIMYCGTDSGLMIYDIADLRNPEKIGSFCEGGYYFFSDLEVEGNIAYLSRDGELLWIIDVSDPRNPALISSIATSCDDFKLQRERLYLLGANTGIEIYDVADPRNPQRLGLWESNEWLTELNVVGDVAYVVGGQPHLRSVDVSDQANPRVLGSCSGDGQVGDVAADGNIVFASDWTRGVLIAELSNNGIPTQLGHISTPELVRGIEVIGDLLYVCLGEAGVRVYNIVDPENPHLIGVFDTPGEALDIAKGANFFVVADGAQGLRVIQNSGGGELIEIGRLENVGAVNAVIIEGDIAYATRGEDGVFSVDLRDPTNPTEIGQFNTTGQSLDLALQPGIQDELLFVADGDSGLQVLHVDDPSSIQMAANYKFNTRVQGITLDETHAYICGNGYRNVVVLDIEEMRVVGMRWESENNYGIALTNGFIVLAQNAGMGVYQYNPASSVDEQSPIIPAALSLSPPFPNPFNSSTTISYSLPKAGWTTLEVVDINGRLVQRLSDGWKEAGSYREVWEGGDCASGVYKVRLSSPTATITQSLIYLR